MSRLVVSALLGLALSGLAPSAGAQTPPADESAREDAAAMFKEGLALFEEDKAADALPLFRGAVEATSSPNARLMLARCLQKLNQNVEAYQQFQQVVRDAEAQASEKYAKARESAQNELAALKQQVALLSLSLPESPPGLQIQLDGEPFNLDELDQPKVVAPGAHELTASADEHETFAQKLVLRAGQAESITLTLLPKEPEPEAPPPKPEPASPPPAPPPEPAATPLRTVGYVVAGVGVVGLGVFATTGLMARGKYNSVNDACGGIRCEDPKYANDIDSGKSLQTVANVSLVVGAAGVLTGGALIFLGGSSKEQAPTSAVSAAPLPGGAYLGYARRF